jgi:hypothetical protein
MAKRANSSRRVIEDRPAAVLLRSRGEARSAAKAPMLINNRTLPSILLGMNSCANASPLLHTHQHDFAGALQRRRVFQNIATT